MDAWDRRTRSLIAIAAVAPFVALAIIPDQYDNIFLFVDFASWFVFLVDYVVRVYYWKRYANTGSGIFDLVIVVATFPWQIFAFVSGAEFLAVFRMARLVRLLTATNLVTRTANLVSRFGALGIWILGSSIFSALVVLNAEPPESGFENFGDAIWWTMVSFTTVGYGDLYPTTVLGRFAGGLMMLTGLAALGSVAAILGSALGADDQVEDIVGEDPILAELAELKSELADIRRIIEEQPSGTTHNSE